MTNSAPQRLTRAQSQAQTKRRLLDAAREIVRREGLAAVTVSRIASDAGVTTGAVYSNFKAGRAELLLEVTRDLSQPIHDMPPVEGGARAWLSGIAALLADHTDSVGAVSLATEMMSVSLRDDKVRPAAAAVALESIDTLAQVLEQVGSGSDSFTTREIAVLAMAMFAGLAQYRALLGPDEVSIEMCARAFSVLADGNVTGPGERRVPA